jgi:hypothetical protein
LFWKVTVFAPQRTLNFLKKDFVDKIWEEHFSYQNVSGISCHFYMAFGPDASQLAGKPSFCALRAGSW